MGNKTTEEEEGGVGRSEETETKRWKTRMHRENDKRYLFRDARVAIGVEIAFSLHRSVMWASSLVLLAAGSRDLFQAPVSPGFLASPVSSSQYTPALQTLAADPVNTGSFFEAGSLLPPAHPAESAPSSDYIATACAVAMFAVAGYGIAQRSAGRTSGPAPSRERMSSVPMETHPAAAASAAGDDAVLSEAMREVQDIIAEMASSPAALQAALEGSPRVRALAEQTPAVAAALKDPAMVGQEMKLLDVVHQLLGGMRGALQDPQKKAQARAQLQELIAQAEAKAAEVPAARARYFARPATTRAGSPLMQSFNSVDKKIISFDRDGVFEVRERGDPKPPVKLLNRVNELRVLTSLADAGLLSKAEKAGAFSKLEAAGAFSTLEKLLPLADDLQLLGTLEDLLNVPANLQVFGAVAVLGAETALISAVPDDNVALIAIQVVTGLLAGGGAVTLLASAYFFSLLQGEN